MFLYHFERRFKISSFGREKIFLNKPTEARLKMSQGSLFIPWLNASNLRGPMYRCSLAFRTKGSLFLTFSRTTALRFWTLWPGWLKWLATSWLSCFLFCFFLHFVIAATSAQNLFHQT